MKPFITKHFKDGISPIIFLDTSARYASQRKILSNSIATSHYWYDMVNMKGRNLTSLSYFTVLAAIIRSLTR